MQTQIMSQPSSQHRDDGVTFLALYHFLISLVFLAGTVVMAVPTLILAIVAATTAAPAVIGMVAVGFVAAVTMTFALLYLAVGYGLWTLRSWARIMALALALPSLLLIPVGTVAGAATLWHLLKPEVAARFEAQA